VRIKGDEVISDIKDKSLKTGDFVEVIGWTNLPFLRGVVIRIIEKKTTSRKTRASPIVQPPVPYKTFEILCIKTGKIMRYDDLYYTIRRIE
tara:strand:+ start:187 stop:459 length:273 start_codon:yes stop_codon:yes gene_type:complete